VLALSLGVSVGRLFYLDLIEAFMEFTRVALTKLNHLISREDFVEVLNLDIGTQVVSLKFQRSRCDISSFGRCTWANNSQGRFNEGDL
jgi:hypothetical protein